MRLAVENERLQAEVESQLAEVRASRARIVAAGDAERQRVERDLHDGAQQRLVVADPRAPARPDARSATTPDPAVARSLEQASEEARAALAELRELARGIHPADPHRGGPRRRGASRSPTRSPATVAVDVGPDAGFAPAVEATAYFVVSEALANVAKYAEAGAVHGAAPAGRTTS